MKLQTVRAIALTNEQTHTPTHPRALLKTISPVTRGRYFHVYSRWILSKSGYV